MRRLLAAGLALVMVILLCSCSGGNSQTTEDVSQVFQAVDTADDISQPAAAGNAEIIEGQITLPDGYSIDTVAVWSGTVYIAGGHGLYAAPLTGGTASPLCETSGSIDTLAPTDDGIWLMSDEELIHIGADGAELARADTTGFFEDGVYVSITGAPNGAVIVYSGEDLYTVDRSGAADTITLEDLPCWITEMWSVISTKQTRWDRSRANALHGWTLLPVRKKALAHMKVTAGRPSRAGMLPRFGSTTAVR